MKVDYTQYVGQMFGRWLILEVFKEDNKTMCKVECQCEAHKIKTFRLTYMTSKLSNSCGCLQKETTKRIANDKRFTTKLKYDLNNSFGIGYTNKNEEFYFDLEDYDLIKYYGWYKDPDGYLVARNIFKSDDNDTFNIKMHRLIMKEDDPSIFIDHIFHNKNDNRKENLRRANYSESSMNKGSQINSKTKISGVCFNNKVSLWRAYIKINQGQKYLGQYIKIEDAIYIRKLAEKVYFKDYTYFKNDIQCEMNGEEFDLFLKDYIEKELKNRPNG